MPRIELADEQTKLGVEQLTYFESDAPEGRPRIGGLANSVILEIASYELISEAVVRTPEGQPPTIRRMIRGVGAFLHRSSVLRKFLGYAASHQVGLHKEHLGVPLARVLTVTQSAKRAEAMRQVAANLVVEPQRLPVGLFLFGVQPNGQNPLESDWVDAAGGRVTLAPATKTSY